MEVKRWDLAVRAISRGRCFRPEMRFPGLVDTLFMIASSRCCGNPASTPSPRSCQAFLGGGVPGQGGRVVETGVGAIVRFAQDAHQLLFGRKETLFRHAGSRLVMLSLRLNSRPPTARNPKRQEAGRGGCLKTDADAQVAAVAHGLRVKSHGRSRAANHHPLIDFIGSPQAGRGPIGFHRGGGHGIGFGRGRG